MGGTLVALDNMVALLLLGFLITCASTYQAGRSGEFGGQGSKQSPVITSQTRTFRAPVSDEVTLPCTPEHLGKFVVVWKHGEEVLSAGAMMVTPDSRYSLVGGYNLKISSINERNSGDYSCTISTFGLPVSVTHTLEILVPPTVRAEPSDGNFVVKKGRRAELRCVATGNPKPEIHWSREDGFLPNGETTLHTRELVVPSIGKEDAGVYTCTASNGVGSPARAFINLQVLYPPEIELETDRVHSGENKEAHLTCLIQGNPMPTVRWYRDSNLLAETDTVSFQTQQNRHTLILRSIRSGLDFGNYSCVAENSLGTFKKHIEVHGRPTAAVFRSKPNTHQDQSYQLAWSVDSYSPIEEYRLLYRKIKPYHGPLDSSFPLGEGDWTNVIISGDLADPGFTHMRTYLISNLLPDSEYECLVQARNRFGWSDASRLFTFYTSTNIPVAHDLEWRTSFSSSPPSFPSKPLLHLHILLLLVLSAFLLS